MKYAHRLQKVQKTGIDVKNYTTKTEFDYKIALIKRK